MKYSFLFILLCGLMAIANPVEAQFNRIDTTLKIGKVGYHVRCSNKSAEKNELTIKPVGFDNSARELDFYIKGKISKLDIDDLNNDSYPDLVIYLYSGNEEVFGTVYAFMSSENKSIMAVALPDAMLDGKLKDGYRGHDRFSLLEGMLIQEFPIYKPEDEKDKPTGGKRFVQYQIVATGDGGYKFKLVRIYETKA
jgi:hypothetical protein